MNETNDQVGFGRPPKQHQFKPGQSGNPKGRPKSKGDRLQDAAAILSKPVKATMPDGEKTQLEAYEAGYLRLCKKALDGNMTALKDAIDIALQVNASQEAKAKSAANFKSKLKRMIGSTDDGDGNL